MSNSGNTLSKKTIAIIVIIAILLVAAIVAVVVFLRDQGQTSAMAENDPQSVAEEQNAEPEQQSTPEEQSAETPSTDDGAQIPTDVASVDDATTEGTDNAGTQTPSTTGTTTGTTGGTATTSTTTGNTQNAGTTTTTDANNIQGSVIEETQTTYDEEKVKVEEGEILSWTPEAPLTVLVGMANNMKLNAPKLVTDKKSVVVNKDGTEAEDQTKIDLTQKIKYTVTIENLGNVAGTIEATDSFDAIPEGLDLSSATDLSAILTDVEGNTVETEEPVFDFSKDIVMEGNKVILKNDITLEAGQKLELTYALKVNPDYLKDGENLVASKDIAKNIVTINNVPVEDDKEYDAVEPIIKAKKTSVITRNGTEIAGTAEDPAKVGDIITYTIHIENNGGADTNIKVKDNNLAEILTKADFLGASRSDKVPVSKDDLLNEMEIMMYHERPPLDIVFKVQLKDISGIITNGITVTNPDEENPDPDVEDPDEIYTINITAEKHADKEQVKEKEEIKYTITLTNTGNTAGSTVVKDTIPEGTTFKAGTVEINGVVDATKTAEDLANGITVNVPANNGTATVAFVVTANVLPEGKENATIKNTAIVGEGEDEEEVPSEEDPEVEKSYVSLTVNKAWVDNEIQSAQRQDVTFELTADGIATGETKELQEETTPAEVVFEGLTRYAEDGHEIAYSVKEVNAGKFYNSAVGATTTDPATGNAELTVTNTFKTPEEIKEMTKDYTVTKVWEDENNKAEKRTNVTLIVSGNGESTKIALPVSKEEFANNQWQGTVTMPQYNANGEEIVYTAQEETVPQFYTASANGLTVTNTFVVPTDATEVKINKTWKDNDIQKQRRPDQIKFTLEATLEDGTVVENVTRNGEQIQVNGKTYVMDVAGDNQTYTFTGLPVYDDNANTITYDVEESVIDGEEHKDDLKFYNSSKENIGKNNIQFTNTFKTPEEIDDMTTKIPVTKVWEDNDDKAEKRPSELNLVIKGTNIDQPISYNVLFDEVANSKDNNTWAKEINVQQYDNNGQEIAYTLTEPTVPDFYTKEIQGMTVVNTFVGSDEQKTIKVTKVWDDNNNNAGKRPGSIQFTATGTDTTKPENEQTITKTTTLSASSAWTGTITVPKYDGNANEIEYTVSEQTDFTNSKFYQASDPVVTKDASGFTTAVSITNTFAVPDEDVSLTVNKTWVEDNATQAERRPGSIRFTVKANGVATERFTDIDISKTFEDKDYSYTFTGLDRYDELGNPIDYTIEESKAGLEFYTSETTGTETDTNGNKTVNVTNTFTLPEDNVKPTTITKVWKDNNNEAGKRPTENITLELTSNDGETNTQDVVVSANNTNTWTTVVNLQTYNEDGVKIEYTLAEPTVPEFYQSPIVNGMTVTNTFKTPEQIEKDYRKDITITKVWEDNNDAKNARPENVTFNVIGKANGTVAYNKAETIQEDLNKNTWTKTINVPVYDSLAREISYTVQEANIPNGYVAKTEELTVTNILPGIEVEKDVVEVKHGETTTPYEEGFTGTIPVEEGDIIKYNISVRNTSSVTINNVTVTDDTLAVTTNSNGEDGITPNIGTIENLLPNESRTYTVYHKVTAQEVLTGGTKITNTVTVTGRYNDGKDTITEDDDATVTVKDINDISVVKEQKVNGNVIPNGTEVKLGQKITYTITVTNEGNTTLKDVVVNDTIFGIAGELNIKPTAGVTVSGDKTNGYVFTIGELPARATKVITAEYTVIEADISENSKEIRNVATVNAKTTGGDPVDPETSEVDVVTEKGKPIIDVVKTSTLKEINGKKNDNIAEYGDIITYTITATNTGIISGDVTITDKVPTGTELYRNGTTNLTAEELNELETEAGLTKVLNVAPNGGKSTITFSVKVTAKPGEDILNTATVNNDGEITEESDNGNDVEKTVSVTAKSQTSTIKNSNVVIVLDVSGSMDDEITKTVTKPCPGHMFVDHGDWLTNCYQNDKGEWVVDEEVGTGVDRITKAKEVVGNFIDSIKFAEDGTGSAVSVITFADNTNLLSVSRNGRDKIANTKTEADYLVDTSLNRVNANGGTYMASALKTAKDQLTEMEKENPDNKNIVIFVGDGEPSDWNTNNIKTNANELIKVSDAVYSIGFEADVEALSWIASKPENYKTTSDDLDLSDIFSEVIEDLGDEEPVDTVTKNGIIELTDIDTTKKVKLVVKNPEQPSTTTEELIREIPQIKQRADGTYYLDVTEFDAGADISIQYVMKE